MYKTHGYGTVVVAAAIMGDQTRAVVVPRGVFSMLAGWKEVLLGVGCMREPLVVLCFGNVLCRDEFACMYENGM